MLAKHMPNILSKTVELRGLKVKSKEEFDILNKIKTADEVKEMIPKAPKGPDGKPVPGAIHVKAITLIVGYMFDLFEEKDKELPSIKEDLEKILKTMPSYIDILL